VYFRTTVKIGRLLKGIRDIIRLGMKEKLGVKEILAIHCPICGAAPGEKYESSSGQPRSLGSTNRHLLAICFKRYSFRSFFLSSRFLSSPRVDQNLP
jgi:hypothetical protein